MSIYNKETGKYEITFKDGTKKEFDSLEYADLRIANLEGTKGISIIESEELSYKIIKTETHFFIGCQKISVEGMKVLNKELTSILKGTK